MNLISENASTCITQKETVNRVRDRAFGGIERKRAARLFPVPIPGSGILSDYWKDMYTID